MIKSSMDSLQKPQTPNLNRESKRSQNRAHTPPRKDAYARLLSQHHSSKFTSYLEQYAKDLSCQIEENSLNTAPQSHSAKVNIPLKRDQVPKSLDASEFLPSAIKTKEGEISLALCMEKLGCDAQKECERTDNQHNQQRHGQRRDTATSQDGDIESGEDLYCSKHSSAKKHQRKAVKKENPNKNVSSTKPGCLVEDQNFDVGANTGEQEQDKAKKSKKKIKQKHQEEETDRKSVPLTSRTCLGMNVGEKKKTTRTERRVFEDYMTHEEVSHGLKRGELVQGQLRINPKNYKEAFIPSPDDSWDIFLDGLSARNRAFNGDIVVVQILPREHWRVVRSDTDGDVTSESDTQTECVLEKAQTKSECNQSHGAMKELTWKARGLSLSDTGESQEDPLPVIVNEKNLQKTGKVVYIVEKNHSRAVTGFLKFLPDKSFAKFSPVDHRVPRINVPLTDCPADFSVRADDYTNTMFICRITNWAADSNFAQGTIAKTLGQAGEIEPQTEGILTELNVDFSEFSDDVLDCLPTNLPWTIPAEEMSKRRDLRKECIFTIDPATARDLDDALSCKQLPDGTFEVGVHIADVSYFVEEGNELDAIASQRSTSVYLVQKVIPMLPRLLCEELCSLNPLTDRLTFSVIWKLSPEGQVLSQWFGRSVIRSCVKLSYDHAQSMIDAPDKLFSSEELPPVDPEHPIDEIHQAVLNLHSIAKHIRSRRFGEGTLRLDQSKLSFMLDKETMMPQGCFVYQYRDSNKLVEEFMLLANITVATHIYHQFPDLALLRCHPPPKTKMMEELQELCCQLGFKIDISTAGALHKSLHAVGDDEFSSFRTEVLTKMFSKPMQMALYFCSGRKKVDEYKHYALNVPLYTHFTSPIRRYADIIVHRLLAASLKLGPHIGLSADQVQRQAVHCNAKKEASKKVQDFSSELYFAVFIKECGPLDSQAMVIGVLDKSFDVLVLKYGVQARIHCQCIEGLNKYNHQKVGKVSVLTLFWKSDNPESLLTEQVISVFALVDVQLKASDTAMKYTTLLKRPED